MSLGGEVESQSVDCSVRGGLSKVSGFITPLITIFRLLCLRY